MDALFTPFNAPFLVAFGLIILIGIIELLSLLAGTLLSAHFDAAIDTDAIASSESFFAQGLSWLHVGRLPIAVVLMLFLCGFATIGLVGQQLSFSIVHRPLPLYLIMPVALLLAMPVTHFIGKWIAPWLPHDETHAISEADFIGCLAIVTGPSAKAGRPTECKLIDHYGQTHYLRVEPEPGNILLQGEKVLIIERLSASCFLAEQNPWPELLK